MSGNMAFFDLFYRLYRENIRRVKMPPFSHDRLFYPQFRKISKIEFEVFLNAAAFSPGIKAQF